VTDTDRRTSGGDQLAPSLEPAGNFGTRQIAHLARGCGPTRKNLYLYFPIEWSERPVGQTVHYRVADALERRDCRLRR